MLKLFRSVPPSGWTDEALLARYLSDGDMRYLGMLYERYMPMVYGVCMKIFRDSGKSEDAVMAIFESLTVKVKEHEIESFRGWLYVTARNHCLMEWRKAQRMPTDFQAPDQMQFFDAVEPGFEVELPGHDAAPLEKCLKQLPDKQRESVEMFYYKNMSYQEIADTTSEEIGKIRSYIQNGRRNLRICLEGLGVRTTAGRPL